MAGALVVAGAAIAPPAASANDDVLVGCNGANGTGSAGDLAAFRAAITSQNGTPGADTILLTPNCTYSFTTSHIGFGWESAWYGPAALPAILSDITIEGRGAIIQRDQQTVALFRLFFVGADPDSPGTQGYATGGAGKLTLRDVTLKNGSAHGGGGGSAGGGGAGMGGAIYNQGQLTLDRVTIRDSHAEGGNGAGLNFGGAGGGSGGGVGPAIPGTAGGGFGAGFGLGGNGGQGGQGPEGGTGSDAGAGGGGGGFRAGENGAGGSQPGPGGSGGGGQTGLGGAGGAGGGASGNGSGGGGSASSSGSGLFIGGGSGGDGGRFGDGGQRGTAGSGGFNPYSTGGGGGGGGVGGGGGGGGDGASAAGSAGDSGGSAGAGGGGGFGGGGGPGGNGGDGGDNGLTGHGGNAGNGAQGGAGGFGGGGGGGGRSGVPGNGDRVANNGSYGSGGSGNNGGFGGGAGSASLSGFTGGGGGGAGMGGAIFNHQGQLTVRNSTFSGNQAKGGRGGGATSGINGAGGDGQGLGGAIFNLNGTATVDSATIAFNQAFQGGGGIYNLGYLGVDGTQCAASPCPHLASVTLVNSIVSNSPNDGFGNPSADLVSNRPATTSTGAANLVPATVAVGTGNNIVVTSQALGGGAITGSAITTDPDLAPDLAANVPGGTTPPFIPPATHAITKASPAYNTGATALATDQRGVARPTLGAADIGAFEFTLITPTMTLDPSPASPGVGEKLRMQATLTSSRQTSGTVTFRLYGPSDPTCAGTPMATSSASGNAFPIMSDYSDPVTQQGNYAWTVSYSGDTNNFPVALTCQTVAVGKAHSVLFADALPTVAALGDQIQDIALVNGYNPTGSIAFKLYGPADTTCTGTPVFTSTTPGTDRVRSAFFTPTAAGTYRWIASYAGDADNTAVAGTCGEARQTVSVSFKPTLSTQAVPAAAELGDPIHAEATLVGGTNPTGTVTFTLFAPTDTNCYTPIFTSAKALSAQATATSDPFTLIGSNGQYSPLGTYRWKASYGGDANNPPSVAQACGASGQTVVVTKATPIFSGRADQANTALDGLATYTATLVGLVSPTGAIHFTLHTDSACATTRIDGQDGSISSASRNAAGDWVVTSRNMNPRSEGVFYWKFSYDGDSENLGVSNVCGAANQSVAVGKITPTLTISQLVPSVAKVGQGVKATAVLGDGAFSGRLFFVVYRQANAGDPCSEANIVDFLYSTDGNGENPAGGEVNSGGTFHSAVFTPSAAGTYWWNVHYTADNRIVNSADEMCGPNATLTVVKAATTTSISSDTPDPSVGGGVVSVGYGVSVTSPGGGTPTGDVTVTDGVDSCTGTVEAGTCSLALTTAGARTLTASYAGDDSFTGSSSAGVPHAVGAAPAITSADHTTFDSGSLGSFTFTTTGAPAPSLGMTGALPPGITFVDKHDGTATLGGVATPGNGGTYLLNVTAGNGLGANATQSFTLTVSEATVGTTSVGAPTFPTGARVTITTNVATIPGKPRATGTVFFTIDGSPVAAVAMTYGKATYSSSTLALGSHRVSAGYSGNATYPGGFAGSVSLTVVKGDTTTTLASLRAPVPTGARARLQSVTKRVPQALGSRLGSVTFTAVNDLGARTVATVASNDLGTALWQPLLPDGKWTITSVYFGNTNFNGSTSAPVTVLVGPQSTVDVQNAATAAFCRTIAPGYPVAQTFSPGRSGALDKVSIDAVWGPDWAGTEDLVIEIQTIGQGGRPSGNVVGSGRLTVAQSLVLNGGQQQTPTMSEVTLTTPVAVTAGGTYALVLRSDSYWCAGITFGGTPPGGFWFWNTDRWSGESSNTEDMVYKIWIK